MYKEYRDSYERSIEGDNFDPEGSFNGRMQRAENGLNFALSAFGSFLYFVGAFFFIPNWNQLVIGLWIFIAGSAVIVMAQVYFNFLFLIPLVPQKCNNIYRNVNNDNDDDDNNDNEAF